MQKILFVLIFGCFACQLQAQDTKLQDSISIEFHQDTMQIEQQVTKMLEKDYSTLGMAKAISTLESGYDKLLNKYYQLLRTKLNEEDRNALIEAQRTWLKFREAEKVLIRTVSTETYTGGGTMWIPISASIAADITKDRVIDLYHYLTFGKEE